MKSKSSSSIMSLFSFVSRFILLGLLTFSIIRNIRGLEVEFAGVDFWWQVLIAVTITLASSVLTGSSILVNSENYVRWMLFICGIMFSTVSFTLNYSGAVNDLKHKHAQLLINDPEIIQLMQDIEDVVDRVNAYGTSERQKLSLMQREKELRGDLRNARERAAIEAQNESRKQKINKTAVAMFAVLPEIGIITFTLVIVLLASQNKYVNYQEVYSQPTYQNQNHNGQLQVPVNPQPVNQTTHPNPPPEHKQPIPENINNDNNQTTQEPSWNPFN